MIRQLAGREFRLFAQHEHALFAGELARHVGNDQFAAPAPRDAVIAAVEHHDAGWPLHDDAPTLNAQRQPRHVFEIGAEQAFRIWSESVRRATDLGPYQGLLVSLHQLHLSATVVTRDPATARRETFALNKFQHQQIEAQESLRRQLGMRTDIPLHLGLAPAGTDAGEDRLRFNYRALQLMDAISLQLCCGKTLFERIEPVYARLDTAAALAVRTALVDQRTISVSPWPFDQATLTFSIPARRVSAEPFPDEASFRAAYAAAPIERVELMVIPGEKI